MLNSKFEIPNSVSAQEQRLLLIAVKYQTRDDLDVLFSQSTRVLEYMEGEEIEEPLFLSLVTEDQLAALETSAFEPTVIDDAVDISRYTLLYHPLENQHEKLTGYGEIVPLSGHYTLVKMPEGEVFEHTGEAAQFFDVPFSETVVSPPLRTREAPTWTPAPTQQVQQQTPSLSSPVALTLIAGLLITALLTVVLHRHAWRWRDIILADLIVIGIIATLAIAIL